MPKTTGRGDRVTYQPGPLGKWLTAARRRAGLTQEELADRTAGAVTQSDISRLQRGRSDNPRLTTIFALARALDLDLGDLKPLAAAMLPAAPIAAAPVKGGKAIPLPPELGTVLRKMQTQMDGIAGVVERLSETAKERDHQAARKSQPAGRRKR